MALGLRHMESGRANTITFTGIPNPSESAIEPLSGAVSPDGRVRL